MDEGRGEGEEPEEREEDRQARDDLGVDEPGGGGYVVEDVVVLVKVGADDASNDLSSQG